jgi:hypothetical protein
MNKRFLYAASGICLVLLVGTLIGRAMPRFGSTPRSRLAVSAGTAPLPWYRAG